MSNSVAVPILTGVVSSSGASRFANTNASLDVNGFLFDFKFTVPENYSGGWDFLKEFRTNISLRIGSGVGTQVSLVSDVSIYDLLSYSDLIAGVSMKSTSFVAGEVARVSGYIDIGFFSMGSRDALDIQLNIAQLPEFNVDFNICAVYMSAMSTLIQTYCSGKPTGSDQPYTNVLSVYYIGDDNNGVATARDELGTKHVSIEDAVALSNATGRLEFFTRIGVIYEDTLGLSQDVSMRVPVPENGAATILIKRLEFNTSLLNSNADTITAERNALIAKIKSEDADKYRYLVTAGVING